MSDTPTNQQQPIQHNIYVPGVPRLIRPRSTYTPTNAFKYKKIFDELITNHSNVLVGYVPKVNPTTFRTQLSDALLWLVDNFSEVYEKPEDKFKQRDYAALRGQVKFKLEREGIHIVFSNLAPSNKDGNSQLRTNGEALAGVIRTTSVDSSMQRGWKDKVVEFLGNGDAKMLHIKDVYLSGSDVDWAVKLLLESGLEHKVTSTAITIVR